MSEDDWYADDENREFDYGRGYSDQEFPRVGFLAIMAGSFLSLLLAGWAIYAATTWSIFHMHGG